MQNTEYLKMLNLYKEHWWFKARQDIVKHIIKKYTKDKKDITILDIGCGPGYFFNEYKGIGIEHCDLFKGENIINSSIEQASLTEKFDVILALDVIEHLQDDTIINKFIKENLKDDGFAIITVPAHKKLFNNHDIINGHFRRYDYKDLENLLDENIIEKICYFNSLLYPLEYIVRKFTRGNDNLSMPPKIINYILYKIFSFEKYLLGVFPTGLSLMAVVTKDIFC